MVLILTREKQKVKLNISKKKEILKFEDEHSRNNVLTNLIKLSTLKSWSTLKKLN